jgi:hypothetical protein
VKVSGSWGADHIVSVSIYIDPVSRGRVDGDQSGHIDGSGTWHYDGITQVGGPITIVAKISGDRHTFTTDVARARLSVNYTPPSLTIASPENWQEFRGTDQGCLVVFTGATSDAVGFGFGTNPLIEYIPVTWGGDWSVIGFPSQGAAKYHRTQVIITSSVNQRRRKSG